MLNSAIQQNEPMTVDEFLSFCEPELKSERWELLDGVPKMMTGGTAAHRHDRGNMDRALDSAARKRGCRAMTGFLPGSRTSTRPNRTS